MQEGAAAGAAEAAADGAYRQAVGQLPQLLEEQREQYGQRDIMVDQWLEGGTGPTAVLGPPTAQVALQVLLALADRICRDAAERVWRMDLEIVEGELPRTMQVVRAPASAGAEGDPLLP